MIKQPTPPLTRDLADYKQFFLQHALEGARPVMKRLVGEDKHGYDVADAIAEGIAAGIERGVEELRSSRSHT